jgi:hypothetical protein
LLGDLKKHGTATALIKSKAHDTKTGDLSEDAMKALLTTLAITLASVTPALAANANAAKGSSILLLLFLGFGALIVVFQFIPGLVLFATMLKGLFMAAPKNASAVGPEGSKKA